MLLPLVSEDVLQTRVAAYLTANVRDVLTREAVTDDLLMTGREW